MKWYIALICLATLLPYVAMADTPCGSVSSNVQTLNPIITGAPQPITLATYDLNTHGLSVQFASNRADYFVGVPNQVIVGHQTVPWTSIESYPTALVQDGSTCPVLSSNGTPVLTSGLIYPVTSPNVVSPCPAVTGKDMIQVVALVQAPLTIYSAIYDRTQQYLFVQFADGESTMFVGVPRTAIKGAVMWNNLSNYNEAIMSQGLGTTCPLLAQP